jgi:flap endonuclease-1
MGIKQLFSIIRDEAPDAVKEGEIKNQFGRKVAIVSCANGKTTFLKLTFPTGCV